ncbi:MAG TPA: invasion associated locus B family protein, partial [Devosia sp.]|nr:invasion associated locus B family protein [Devosia sp.]
MKFVGFRWLVAILAIAAMSAPTRAQDGSEQPVATTATYRDWTLRCGQVAAEPPRKVCEVAQAIRSADGKNVLGQVVLGRPAPDQKFKLVVQLPPGVWLPANV